MRITFALILFAAAAFGQIPPTEQRVADLSELIDRKPDFASAYYARGVMLLGLGQAARAEPDFSKVIDLKPDADAYASRADAYTTLKRSDQAIADLSMAISMKPGNSSYYLRRADSYSGKGDCQAAIADYSEVIRTGPREAAYRGRSACRKQLGDATGAAEDDRIVEQMKAAPVVSAPVPLAPIVRRPPSFVPPILPIPVGSGGGIGSATGGGVVGRPTAPASPSADNVYKIGGGVSQPSILFKMEPEYSEEARKAKWQGTVTLAVVVSEFGEPVNVKVIRALGLGLDQQAIEAVQRWVFKPGRKDGQPVAVYATIQVTFHLL